MILTRLLSPTIQNLSKPNDVSRHGGGVFIPPNISGVYVDQHTAMTYSAFWLCVKIISETISALPVNVYNRVNKQDSELASNSPAQILLDQPNDEMTGLKFRLTMLVHRLVWGNAYAEILRDRSNIPRELQLITPDRAQKFRSKTDGKLVHEVSNSGAANSYVADSDMFHYYGMGFNGLTGYSVVEAARRSLGIGMAMENFSSAFYENGTALSGIIEVPKGIELGKDARDTLKDQFKQFHGGVKNFHDIEVLDQGMLYKPLGMPLKDAEFIESKKFSVIEVARWFNMPPHKLKDLERATFSNIEEQNLDFVIDTLVPHIADFEATANWKLTGPTNRRQYVKINLNALLRGNSESRAKFYKSLFDLGWSFNEIRALEDQNSIGPEGDERFMQLNMTTIKRIIREAEEKEINPPKQQPQQQQPMSEESQDNIANIVRYDMNKAFNAMDRIFRINSKRNDPDYRHKKIQEVTNDLTKRLSLLADSVTGAKNTDVKSFIGKISSEAVIYFDGDKPNTLPDIADNLANDFTEFCILKRVRS